MAEGQMVVRDIMTREVATLKPGDKVSDLVTMFSEKGVSGAPVVNDAGKLVGVCSEADVMKTLKSKFSEPWMVYPSIPMMGISFVDQPLDKKMRKAFEEVAGIPVEKIMTKKVLSLPPSAAVSDALKLMSEYGINRIPVVEGGKLIGIVSRADIIKAGARLLEG